MKSLEIVNERLCYIETHPEHKCCHISQKKLQQIKEELVVLEILKKRNVNLSHLLYLFMKLEKGKIKNIDEIHREYNKFQDEKGYLTIGELLKLKQWLEENENE